MRDIFTPLLSASWLNSPMSSLRPASEVGEYLSLWNNLNNNRMGVILAWGKSPHRTFAMGVRCLSRSNSVRILSSLFRFAAAMALMMGSSPRGAATQDGMVTHPHTTHDADGCLHENHQAKPTDAWREQTQVMTHQATATDAWGRTPLASPLKNSK